MVRTTGTARIAPRVKQIVVGMLETPKRRLSLQLVCRACSTSAGMNLGSTWTLPYICEGASLSAARGNGPSDVMRRSAERYTGLCACHGSELSHEEIVLTKGTVLGVAEETSASIVAAINEEGTSNFRSTREKHRKVNMVVNDTLFKE